MHISRAELHEIMRSIVPPQEAASLPAWFDDVVAYVGEKFDEYEERIQTACEVGDDAHGYCHNALRAVNITSYGEYGPQVVEVMRRASKAMAAIHTELLGFNSFCAQRDARNRVEVEARMAAQRAEALQ